MAISITHSFVSVIADDPAAASAGQVTPSNWNDAHVVSGIRPLLPADVIYYVNSATGSDSNVGTSGAPFLTFLHAWNTVCAFDLNGRTATIQLQDSVVDYDPVNVGGLLSPGNTLATPLNGQMIVQGNAGDFTKVTIGATTDSSTCFTLGIQCNSQVIFQNLTFTDNAAATFCALVASINQNLITLHSTNFVLNPVNASVGVWAAGQTSITVETDLQVAGDTDKFFLSESLSTLGINLDTLTLVGTPAYAVGFLAADTDSQIVINHIGSIVGTATGPRYNIDPTSLLQSQVTISSLPGDADGVADSLERLSIPEGPYTVATLPVAATFMKGWQAYVTDALSPTFLGTLTGGSSTVTRVVCTGSAWVPG